MAKGNVIVVSNEVKSQLVEQSTRLTTIDSELESLKVKMKELIHKREVCYNSIETLATDAGLFKSNKGDSIFLRFNEETYTKESIAYRTTQGYNPETGRPGAVRRLVVVSE